MNTRSSFRDPDGFVFRRSGRVYRCVLSHAVEDLRIFLSSKPATEWTQAGTLCGTAAVGDVAPPAEAGPADGSVVFEHTAIRFPNFPYEWPPEMLFSAAQLTLHHARGALDAGFELKDATPYNVMFEGARPVFIDLLSFSRLTQSDGIWRPLAQFMRTFVYPLLAHRYFGLRVNEVLLSNRDGFEPERLKQLCSPVQRLMPPFVGAVTIPLLFSRTADDDSPERYAQRPPREPEEAVFLLGRVLRRAERMLERARPRRGTGERLEYMRCGHTYQSPELVEKESAVRDALARCGARRVLDIGCNTGHFSRLAAAQGASVVAIDHDPDVVDEVWRNASRSNLDILPLTVDIARPPGGAGWANGENPSFLDRARSHFDCVLMLALIHHLMVTERVPLTEIIDLAAELTTKAAVIEYVDRSDLQFRRIARGRDALHAWFDVDAFEGAVRRKFDIVESRPITATRRIYTLSKKAG